MTNLPSLPDDTARLFADLVRAVLPDYPLRPEGTHGVGHWARVWENGVALAKSTHADLEVVLLFAVFHDCQRQNEGWDDGHGLRGAELAVEYRGNLFEISDRQFDLLFEACAYHTDGVTYGDPTVMTCWDADRLDLGRVGIRPDRERLCTDAARDIEILDWANDRARERHVPEWIKGITLSPE
ncbi:MAG: hypothetical protein QGG75_15355 [Alphaproteobacteria bacterium]|jgi:uncharacterized protein|nr:hypothetical protein [Alphaproteobacteria bacterium]